MLKMLFLMASLGLAAVGGYYWYRSSGKREADRHAAMTVFLVGALAVAVSILWLVPEAVLAAYAGHIGALIGVAGAWLVLRRVKQVLVSLPAASEPVPMPD